MNRVELIGRAVKDVVLYDKGENLSYCRFTIAVNRFVKNENQTDYIDIVCWNKLAEACAKYIRKGSQVGIVGSIQSKTYTDRNGVKKQSFCVVAENVEFLTPNSKDNSQGTPTDLDNFKAVDDTLPF